MSSARPAFYRTPGGAQLKDAAGRPGADPRSGARPVFISSQAPYFRRLAQPGSAPGLGPGCRRFESVIADHDQMRDSSARKSAWLITMRTLDRSQLPLPPTPPAPSLPELPIREARRRGNSSGQPEHLPITAGRWSDRLAADSGRNQPRAGQRGKAPAFADGQRRAFTAYSRGFHQRQAAKRFYA